MSATAIHPPDAHPVSTLLRTKLLDMFASPGDVFEEVVASPPCIANWLVPTLLAALTGLILLSVTGNQAHTATGISQMAEAGKLSPRPAEAMPFNAQGASSLINCLGVFAGTFWSAFLLWLIGFALLKTRFSYLKALEVVALTSVITTLGAIITALLVANAGDALARPALSLFARNLAPDNHLFLALDTLNVFHLWATTVLALGLARLSGVAFKESAFGVFGYWVLARIVAVILA
jgi:hypothetical protein